MKPTTVQTTMGPTTGPWGIDGRVERELDLRGLQSGPLLDREETERRELGRLHVTFDHGQMSWTEVNPRKSAAGSATLQVDDDVIVMQTKSSEKFAMRWHLEGHQLTCIRDVSKGVGPTPFVIKSWIRQP